MLTALTLVLMTSIFEPCTGTGGLIGCAQQQQQQQQHQQRPRLLLAGTHFATPVPRPHVPDPIQHARTDLFLLGLGLTLGGLVLGGAGFAVLALCSEGNPCYSQTTTIIGWALAAPGVIPLAVGLAILYFYTGGRRASLVPADTGSRWAFTAAPLNGGAMLGAATRF